MTTALAIFVGAILGIAVGAIGLTLVAFVLIRSQEAFDAAELRRMGCRREAGLAGGHCGSRPAEPDRDALLRVFRDTGWIDVDAVRRYSR